MGESEFFLFSSLASQLSKSERSSKADISETLKFICGSFEFEQAALYELVLTEYFSLQEHTDWPFLPQVPQRDFSPVKYHSFIENPFSYLTRNEQNTPGESWILNFFSAQSVFLAPIVCDDGTLDGFIVFRNFMSADPLSQQNLDLLGCLVTMLINHVSVRIYKRKFTQLKTTMERILDNTGIDIYVNDFYNHDILYVNHSMAAPYGGQERLMGEKCWQILFPGQTGPCAFCPMEKLIDDHGKPTKVYSWDYQRPFDGSWFRVFSAAFRWADGRLAHVVSSADITDNKRNEALIENLANYDQLTKLPNRRMLVLECERRIDKASENEEGYVLFFDIDGFKSINDTLGHDAGDEFLIQLGQFFASIPLLKDAIYRNGGDEFVAVIGGKDVTKFNIESLANFILTRFQKPWKLKKGEIYSNTSIGVACYPEDGVTAEDLLQKADMAMYQVKKSGGKGLCFGNHLSRLTQ